MHNVNNLPTKTSVNCVFGLITGRGRNVADRRVEQCIATAKVAQNLRIKGAANRGAKNG